jgi:HSP20 family protein
MGKSSSVGNDARGITRTDEGEMTMTNARLLPALWESFGRLHGEMDHWLENLGPAAPAVNVWEDENAFHVEMEVPGLLQDNLQVAVTHRTQLTIQGERQPETAEGRWHRRERGQGRFQRVLELPGAVDADRVEAKLENGLLLLTLPKAAEARPRRIVVKAE